MQISIEPDLVQMNMFYDTTEPILESDFIKMLKDKGYEMRPQIDLRTEQNVVGLKISNPIATKENVSVNYDVERGGIDILGNEFESVLQIFKEIEEILKEEGSFEEIKRFEFFTQVKAKIGKESVSTVKLLSESINEHLPKEKLAKIEELVGEDLVSFCIRLCPKIKTDEIGNIREYDHWIDVYIFPYIPNTKYLSLYLVYRDKNAERVKEFAENSEEKLKRILGVTIYGSDY